MDRATFFKHFELLADTPSAVEKMRKLVFELAAEGKILQETGAPVTPVSKTKLGSVAEFIMGQAPPGNECNTSGEGTIFVKAGEFGPLYAEAKCWTTKPLKFSKRGDVLICVVGATVGKLNLAIDSAIGRSVAAIRPGVSLKTRFLYYMLMPFVLRLRESSRGSAQGVIGKDDLGRVEIWVPDTKVQANVVAKVEELMGLCDELEARQQAQREACARLTQSAFTHLTAAKDEQSFRRHAGFVLQHADITFDDVIQLRQTILQLAVQGRLVPQDPKDESAAKLLSEICNKKQGTEPEDKRFNKTKEDFPFAVKQGWAWARFDEVATIKTNMVAPKLFGNLPHVAPDNIEKGSGKLLPYRTVAEDGVQSGKHHFFPGQIIYSKIRPNLSKAIIVGFEGLCSADMYPITAHVNSQFLLLYMLSSSFLRMAVRNDTRVAMPKINQIELNQIPVPVPPLAEQKRIVAKVRELMRLCDELESRLAQSRAVGEQLLEATIRQLLAA